MQVATDDPDYPNSVDVTLGNFVDDFQVTLDQAWVRYKRGDLAAYASLTPNLQLDPLWYRYRPLDTALAGALKSSEWPDRIRLAFMVSF